MEWVRWRRRGGWVKRDEGKGREERDRARLEREGDGGG